MLSSPSLAHKSLHHLHHHNQHNQPSNSQTTLSSLATPGSSKNYLPESSKKIKSTHDEHKNSHLHVVSSHHSSSHAGSTGLWMLIDGIGLAMIQAATILEGIELWKEVYGANWDTNSGALSMWVTGRSSQILGLLFLIGHAATFQIFPQVEQLGMLFLTIGPILNLLSCLFFHIPSDLTYSYNRQWLCSESLELLGIGILDISMIHMEEIYVFTAEITGFLILCCAAGLHFEFSSILPASEMVLSAGNDYFYRHLSTLQIFPSVSLRLDMVHSSECVGLVMLMIVAYGQYLIKTAAHQTLPTHHATPSTPRSRKTILHV